MADHFSEYDAFNVPPEFRPLGAFAYFGLSILFSIPIVGLIFLIIFSLSDANINRRNYARSYFIVMLFVIIALVLLALTGVLNETMDAFNAHRWPSYLLWMPGATA